MRKLLLGVQVFISVLLLISAGLLLRSVRMAGAWDPGFACSDVSLATIELPANAYNSARNQALIEALADRIGVHAVTGSFAFTLSPPFGSAGTSTLFRRPGENGNAAQVAYFQEVSSSYFEVLRIPILAGRNFQAADRNRKFLLVNETMAKRYWPDGNAVGQTILVAEPSTASFSMRTVAIEEATRKLRFQDSYELIGIVRDAHTTSLDRVAPTCYRPVSGSLLPYVLFKSGAGLEERLRIAISDLEGRAKVQINTLTDRMNRSLRPMRVGASIALLLGILALLVASIGMFGVAAYLVQQRSQELSVRLVLGARIGQVVWLVLSSSSGPSMSGLGLGLAASGVTSMMLKRYLFGIGYLDPITFITVTALVTVTVFTASLWPLRRAIRIDPMHSLRCE